METSKAKIMVSIIVVNWNGEHLLRDCFSSLNDQIFRDFEVVFVDNASSDNSLRFAKELSQNLEFPMRFLSLSSNKGFTGGNIEGFKLCSGELIALLNNDAIVDKHWCDELVKAMNTHPDAGMCASKMVVDGTDVIDSAGDGYSRSLRGFKRGEGEVSDKFCAQIYVFGACAGAALYRRKMLDEIGFLDEDFFINYEDIDLSLRAQLAGWKTLFVPSAIVYHKVSASIKKMSDVQVYYSIRNPALIRVKNIPFLVFLRCFPEFVLGFIAEFYYFAIKHKRVRLYFKAKFDAVKLLRGMLEKRKRIMFHKKVNYKYLLSIMTPAWQIDYLKNKMRKLFHG